MQRDLNILIWPHEEAAPVLAGRLSFEAFSLSFRYDRTYLGHPKAISIYGDDLKMHMRSLHTDDANVIFPSLRDALPDRWGRRVIATGLRNDTGKAMLEDDIIEATVMLHTGPDRIGALDFRRPDRPISDDQSIAATLEELMALADLVEGGGDVPADLHHLIPHCASVGGARPKALFTDTSGRKYIAKFTAANDSYPVIQGEFIAMRLASLAGINAARVELATLSARHVLLVERFDRTALANGGWARKAMVSALTWTHENELSAHHISYAQLAESITDRFEHAAVAQEELFQRLVFNILVGNTDDHARNHAAFWDGATHELTPAYDIAPQRRTTREANQAMVLANGSRAAQLRIAAAAAPEFGISTRQFRQIVDRQVGAIIDNWTAVCDEAMLSRNERETFVGRQFFNDYAFEGFGPTPTLP
jgi:serine/threonine-protein kinase HipA